MVKYMNVLSVLFIFSHRIALPEQNGSHCHKVQKNRFWTCWTYFLCSMFTFTSVQYYLKELKLNVVSRLYLCCSNVVWTLGLVANQPPSNQFRRQGTTNKQRCHNLKTTLSQHHDNVVTTLPQRYDDVTTTLGLVANQPINNQI